jgi:hypothetical protein
MGQKWITRLQVYDPPMCCPSGVCGPSVNPVLPRFAADVEWLKQQGVEVERYSLSSQPAAFVQQQAVKDALENDGNNCLPLVVVNGTIVSKGIYPTRSTLMKLSGIDGKKVRAEATPAGASSVEPGHGAPACGPGCACGTPSGGRNVKMAVSLIVLLAVAGIFIYKAAATKDNASNNTAATGGAAFAFAQPAPSTIPGAESQSSRTATPDVATAGQKVGEYLESLSALNKVAVNQDAVFVFIPARNNDLASDKTNTALLAAQRTLKSSKITLGLYTLPTSSPDYSAISAQVQAPAILVASKGKGMAAVSGDVTEAKLLQAFVASSRAGGCGPSGCGPSGGACN